MRKRPRICPTNKEIIAISEKLREVIVPSENGLVAYLEGWSDERVQKEAAPRLTPTHIGRIRVELHGKVRPPRVNGHAKDPVFACEVRELRQLVDHLYERLNEPKPDLAKAKELA